jgi:hypothetical protein
MKKSHRLGDAPIQEKYRRQMQTLAHALDEMFNPGQVGSARETGFVLLVFPFTDAVPDKERCNFISNGADRKDIVALFKEMIARFEGQPELKGQA